MWENIYKYCFISVPDNHLKWLQFKIINRILGTRSLLFKMNITYDPLCAFCKDSEETLTVFDHSSASPLITAPQGFWLKKSRFA